MNYILNQENEIYYECGYSCDNAIVLVIEGEKFFITDGRYTLDARENANAEVIESGELVKKAREIILKKRVKNLIIDPLKWDVASYEALKRVCNLKNVKNYSQKKRIIKTQNELAIIKDAAREGAVAFAEFAKEIAQVDEYELSYRFKEYLTQRGRRELSFEPIVAINENAAKPHAMLTQKCLKKGDLLLLDAGIKHKRYCSDRTRTISINDEISMDKIQHFKDKKIQKVYDTVLKAQEKALKAIKPGISAKELDKIARDVIEKAGYGKYFVHSLGHGVGLDIHELPRISQKSDDIIKEGMVFTVEPGIYIPGEFGVRIEDMVLIEHNGNVEILSERI
ncbi:MAG: M24 family metallopeptidase [Epsilonproteobacteria bacterium]|nr:M24 family metallopeptidase [Campylobacterota bacterium]